MPDRGAGTECGNFRVGILGCLEDFPDVVFIGVPGFTFQIRGNASSFTGIDQNVGTDAQCTLALGHVTLVGGAIEDTADPAGIDEFLAHCFDDILAIGLDQVVFFEVNQVVILDSTGEGHAQAAHNVDLFAAGQLESQRLVTGSIVGDLHLDFNVQFRNGQCVHFVNNHLQVGGRTGPGHPGNNQMLGFGAVGDCFRRRIGGSSCVALITGCFAAGIRGRGRRIAGASRTAGSGRVAAACGHNSRCHQSCCHCCKNSFFHNRTHFHKIF